MQNHIVPLKNPKPDINTFLQAMDGKISPQKPPMVEYLIDNQLMKPILVNLMGRKWVETSDLDEYMGGQMDFSRDNLNAVNAWLDNQIAFWYHMGYDFVRVEVSLPLPAVSLVTADTAAPDSKRAWQGLHDGPIQTWEDFEKYPWPEVTDKDFYIHEYICSHLPEGMGFMSCHAGGIYEHVSRLMGYSNLCLNLYDNPQLVKAVTDKLGELIQQYNQKLLQFDGLVAIFQGDDFGFNTQTLLPPDDIRRLYLPWHKIYAKMAHDQNRRYYLHSCGKVDDIMDDLIDDVQIDGKHSFQDNVLSIAEYKKRWGDKIALLGGIDIDKLANLEPAKLKKYIRGIIDECAPGGRFAIGSGNSVPSYISVENYLAMLDEALA